MNRLKTCAALAFAFIGTFVATSSIVVGEDHAFDVAAESKRLDAVWSGWTAKAAFIDVDAFHFVGSPDPGATKPDRTEIVDFITKTLPKVCADRGTALDLEALYACTEPLFGPDTSYGTKAGRRNAVWIKTSFVRAENRARLDTVVGGVKMTVVRTGTEEQQFVEGNGEAVIFKTHTPILIPDHHTILFTSDFFSQSVAEWHVRHSAPPTIKLAAEGDHGSAAMVEYDRETCFVSYFGVRVTADKYVHERYQSGPTRSPEGIPIPTIVAEIKYKPHGVLVPAVDVWIVTRAVLGKPVDPSRFLVAVPAGTNVVASDSFTQPPSERRERPVVAKEAVEDVAAFYRDAPKQNARFDTNPLVEQPLDEQPASIPLDVQPVTTGRNWFWIANIAAFVVIAAALLWSWPARSVFKRARRHQ